MQLYGSHVQALPHSRLAAHIPCPATTCQTKRGCNTVTRLAATCASAITSVSDVDAAKENLLSVVAGTQRGSAASSIERGMVAEAQVAVEAFAGPEINWDLLAGSWKLVYTTASDVTPIVRTGAGLPGILLNAFWVGQKFTSPSEGKVQNVIQIEILAPLLENTKLTFIVEAGYEVRTARSIALTFKSAKLESISLGETAQNILAPAVLPRGWWNQKLLLSIAEAAITIPLNTGTPLGSSSSRIQPTGINYMLTYLDENMLIGRAQGNGGVFIYSRDDRQV